MDVDGSLSKYNKEEKKLEISTKIETLKSLLQECQKRNNKMSFIASIKDV